MTGPSYTKWTPLCVIWSLAFCSFYLFFLSICLSAYSTNRKSQYQKKVPNYPAKTTTSATDELSNKIETRLKVKTVRRIRNENIFEIKKIQFAWVLFRWLALWPYERRLSGGSQHLYKIRGEDGVIKLLMELIFVGINFF